MLNNVIEVVAALIERDGEYLITQRTAMAVLPLLWEFPGGRVEPGESKEAALIREVEHRIGLTVAVTECVGDNLHSYDSHDVHITLFSCHLPSGCEPLPRSVGQVRWVASDKLDTYEFPPADQDSMYKLLNLYQ
ncbi:MAG: (deoxy)nucleoside triphosphate pyrophosphohydrolase [Myxococcales bacterium]|nr:(deoxy)nucleoside triphosphate pyrophosphohydrolase [Myxococcales bacterium]